MSEMEGRKASMVSLVDTGGGAVFKASDSETMVVVNEFHGEYDIDWIVHKDSEGKEIRRLNTKMVEMIVWEDA